MRYLLLVKWPDGAWHLANQSDDYLWLTGFREHFMDHYKTAATRIFDTGEI